jgi:hypothetical protein
VRTRRVSGFVATDLICNATHVERTELDIRRDDMDYYYVVVQLTGGSTIIQDYVFEQPIEIGRDIPTGRAKVFGSRAGVRKCLRTAWRTRSLRPKSISGLATEFRSADGINPTDSIAQDRYAAALKGLDFLLS